MVLVVLPALLKLFPTKGSKPPDPMCSAGEASASAGAFLAPVHLPAGSWGSAPCRSVLLPDRTRVIRNFADDSRLIRDYRFIEENLAGISTVETIVKFDKSSQKALRFLQRMEVVRQVADSVRKHSHVSGAVCLSDFQPVRTPPEDTAGHVRRSSTTAVRVKPKSGSSRPRLLRSGSSWLWPRRQLT